MHFIFEGLNVFQSFSSELVASMSCVDHMLLHRVCSKSVVNIIKLVKEISNSTMTIVFLDREPSVYFN